MQALVVDDSRAMRSILARLMTGLGFEVAQAGDGQEALDHARGGLRPDVALVDWNMPVMDGLTFIKSVRARDELRDIALMMVTTESEQAQIVRALAAGAARVRHQAFQRRGHRREARAAGAGAGVTPPPGRRPSRIRVLVVDDSVVIRRLVTDALGERPRDRGRRQAPNGQLALEQDGRS